MKLIGICAHREPVDKTNWVEHSKVANFQALNSVQDPSIKIFAGILHGVFFNSKRPKYMNYGAIGSMIGHEITHGFDSRGSKFDKNGNLKNWWEDDAATEYATVHG